MQLSWLEQLICNQQVVGSSPSIGSYFGEILKRSTRTDCKSVGYAFVGSNPALPTKPIAGVAQLVERQPSKLNVAGSNPVFRSNCRCSSGVERFLGKEKVSSSNLDIGSLKVSKLQNTTSNSTQYHGLSTGYFAKYLLLVLLFFL